MLIASKKMHKVQLKMVTMFLSMQSRFYLRERHTKTQWLEAEAAKNLNLRVHFF